MFLRVKEDTSRPLGGILEKEDRPITAKDTLEWVLHGNSDAIYGRSLGGRSPLGWDCAHNPYIVEFDNWSYSGKGGVPGLSADGHCWIWGYDEICWFARLPAEERQAFLQYAFRWLGTNDPDGFVQPATRRGLAAPAGDRPVCLANRVTPACLRGFGDEDTIAAIFSTNAGRIKEKT